MSAYNYNENKVLTCCDMCGKRFEAYISTLLNGEAKYCSKECSSKAMSIGSKLRIEKKIAEHKHPMEVHPEAIVNFLERLKKMSHASLQESAIVEALNTLGLKPDTQYIVADARTIIDIVFTEEKIAIYADGWGHTIKKHKDADDRIDVTLRAKGWVVLRFLNSQIDRDLDTCIEAILATLHTQSV